MSSLNSSAVTSNEYYSDYPSWDASPSHVWGEALRDDTNNGCVGDYYTGHQKRIMRVCMELKFDRK